VRRIDNIAVDKMQIFLKLLKPLRVTLLNVLSPEVLALE
jgi:hypothetical protein